jgi:signal peptide peptidase SppA
VLQHLTSISLRRLFKPGPVVPVVRLSGAIGIELPMRRQLNLLSVSKSLSKAFAYRKAPAVAILINSPGGSPVQSHLIFQRIRALSKEKEKPVLAFVEDVAASGGYLLACAGDEIFADRSSIVGSIGIVSQGFGFVGLMDRIGVERRLHTAGENKAILDPFQPEKEEDVAHLKKLQGEMHEHFISLVSARRGEKLADDPDLFSGLFWTGQTSKSLGLVDQLGELRSVLRERYGEDVRLRLLMPTRPSFLRRFLAGLIGTALENTAVTLEERALWARYGL